jgi:hypothetical protein
MMTIHQRKHQKECFHEANGKAANSLVGNAVLCRAESKLKRNKW